MRSWAVKAAIILVTALFLAGCGGSSSPSKTAAAVAQVMLAPSSLSMVPGEVRALSAQALNANGVPVSPVPPITFNSSNPSLVTVKSDGSVCAGVWDSFFIVCNGTPFGSNPQARSATITATAGGVSSAPIQVSIHPVVTSIQVSQTSGNAFPACNSNKATAQFKAQAFSNGMDITPLVGNFAWTAAPIGTGTQTSSAVSVDTNGLATAGSPGLGGVIATLGTVSSPALKFKSCLPVRIILHVNGDPAGQPTEAVTLNVNDTKIIQADMIDENNSVVASAPGITVISNQPEVASLSIPATGATLTAVSPGGAGLLAVCAPPNCGGGLNTPIYGNLFSVTVNGTSPATTVYATTSFPPAAASPTPTILPIDTSKTPPAAGTAINMPCPNPPTTCAVPNSMVFAPSGAKAYMGTSQGLASLDTGTNTVTLLDPFVGKVLAVSPDGNFVIESNGAPDPTGVVIQPDVPSQRVVIFLVGTKTSESFIVPAATAASFTGDSSKAFISATNPDGSGNTVYVFSTFASFQRVAVAGSNADVATLTSGPFAYLANSGLQVLATCNNTQQPAANNPVTHTTAIQLVQSFKNADVLTAVDSTGINFETATVTAPTPPIVISTSNCPPGVIYSNQFVDFGAGAFTARQLLVGTNVGSHIVVLPKGVNKLLVAVPGATNGGIVTLASGATEALSGGMTPDGNLVWVGVAGTNNVDRVNLTNSTDDFQLATPFKTDVGGTNSAAPPNIVAVKPK